MFQKPSFNKQKWPGGFLLSWSGVIAQRLDALRCGIKPRRRWRFLMQPASPEALLRSGLGADEHREQLSPSPNSTRQLPLLLLLREAAQPRLRQDLAELLCSSPAPGLSLQALHTQPGSSPLALKVNHQFHVSRCRFGFWPDRPWQDKVGFMLCFFACGHYVGQASIINYFYVPNSSPMKQTNPLRILHYYVFLWRMTSVECHKLITFLITALYWIRDVLYIE